MFPHAGLAPRRLSSCALASGIRRSGSVPSLPGSAKRSAERLSSVDTISVILFAIKVSSGN